MIVISLAPEHESRVELCHDTGWETAGVRSQYVWRSHPVPNRTRYGQFVPQGRNRGQIRCRLSDGPIFSTMRLTLHPNRGREGIYTNTTSPTGGGRVWAIWLLIKDP